jgi:hypothetical protein
MTAARANGALVRRDGRAVAWVPGGREAGRRGGWGCRPLAVARWPGGTGPIMRGMGVRLRRTGPGAGNMGLIGTVGCG